MRACYTLAVVCATLSAVAVVCAHNHPNAPWVAAALALVSMGALLRRREMAAARVGAGLR